MLIKIITDKKEIKKRIHGNLKKVAKFYFKNPNVKKIKILKGGVYRNKYYKTKIIELYRVSDEEIKEFELWNNIFEIDYKKIYKGKGMIENFGFCKV